MKIFKKFDVVIIVILIVLSFIPHFIFSNVLSENYKNYMLVLKSWEIIYYYSFYHF